MIYISKFALQNNLGVMRLCESCLKVLLPIKSFAGIAETNVYNFLPSNNFSKIHRLLEIGGITNGTI